eukprot:TRINITY_DN3599_c0_g1_i2.p1 TRINITY_DN3599_c0_g1~~TRINITY_DN3599_c0_g1_i2.p1  ORF type:complete len:404 (+),score=90.66 TRINITY_DN3599_c0_g1_i2:3847-5058(+)
MAAVPASAAATAKFFGGISFKHDKNDFVDIASDIAASRSKPLLAPMVVRRKLNEIGSNKLTSHYTFLLNDKTRYSPGDSLGVVPVQGGELVTKTLQSLGLKGSDLLNHKRIYKGKQLPASEMFSQHLDLRTVPPAIAKLATSQKMKDMLAGDKKKLLSYLSDIELHDFYKNHMNGVDPNKVISLLKPLQPRLYSISSHQAVAGNTVDLTVAKVDYTTEGISRNGTTTHYLHHIPLGSNMTPVFVQKAPKFRPPSTKTPTIMIGPGTGIAPFRSFMQDPSRTAPGAKNWIFFGDQKPQDYLYKDEWAPLQQNGNLKVSTAFSREPGKPKQYVQDKIRQQSSEIWKWVNDDKCSLFICGDAQFMAPGVESALKDTFQKHGNMTSEQAAKYLKDLEKAGRFHKDVY